VNAALAAAEPFLLGEALLVTNVVAGRLAVHRVKGKAVERAQGAAPRTEESPPAIAAMASWAIDIAQAAGSVLAPLLAFAALRPELGGKGPAVYVAALLASVLLTAWVCSRPSPTQYAQRRFLKLSPVDWSALTVNLLAAGLAAWAA